jgi:hypothetical protein
MILPTNDDNIFQKKSRWAVGKAHQTHWRSQFSPLTSITPLVLGKRVTGPRAWRGWVMGVWPPMQSPLSPKSRRPLGQEGPHLALAWVVLPSSAAMCTWGHDPWCGSRKSDVDLALRCHAGELHWFFLTLSLPDNTLLQKLQCNAASVVCTGTSVLCTWK